MGSLTTAIAIVFAAITAILWTLSIAEFYGYVAMASLYNQPFTALAVYGIITAIGAIAAYKIGED